MTAQTIPMKWSNISTHDTSLRCACCDRLLRGRYRWVEVVNGGRDVALPGSNPDQRDSGYMGFFPVGSTCAKQHFPEATHADIP